jgi:hypothetical protein
MSKASNTPQRLAGISGRNQTSLYGLTLMVLCSVLLLSFYLSFCLSLWRVTNIPAVIPVTLKTIKTWSFGTLNNAADDNCVSVAVSTRYWQFVVWCRPTAVWSWHSVWSQWQTLRVFRCRKNPEVAGDWGHEPDTRLSAVGLSSVPCRATHVFI